MLENRSTGWLKKMASISYVIYCKIKSIFLNHPVFFQFLIGRRYFFLFWNVGIYSGFHLTPYSTGTKASFTKSKAVGHEANLSSTCNAKKTISGAIPTLLHTAWCLIKQRDNITFYFNTIKSPFAISHVSTKEYNVTSLSALWLQGTHWQAYLPMHIKWFMSS